MYALPGDSSSWTNLHDSFLQWISHGKILLQNMQVFWWWEVHYLVGIFPALRNIISLSLSLILAFWNSTAYLAYKLNDTGIVVNEFWIFFFKYDLKNTSWKSINFSVGGRGWLSYIDKVVSSYTFLFPPLMLHHKWNALVTLVYFHFLTLSSNSQKLILSTHIHIDLILHSTFYCTIFFS